MSAGERIRPAKWSDVSSLAAILAANDKPIGWPDRPGFPYLEHLVARGRTLLAHVDDEPAGFGGSIEIGTEDIRFVTDLFVHPDHQDRGIGRGLLARLLEGAEDRMTFSSDDDRAVSLYARAGMRPWWPLLYLSGEVPEVDLTDAIETAEVAQTAEWSMRWTGVDRTVDFEHYQSLPDAEGFLVWEAGEVAGAAWARRHRTRPGRWLDHASIAPDVDPLRVAQRLLAAAGDGEPLTAPIPAPSPAVAWWLEGGAAIVGSDLFCATDPELIDPERMLPNPGFV